MSSSDHTVLQHWIRDRDANAFEELTSKYSGLVYATCLRITRNRVEAEDVTQECFASLAMVADVPRSPLGAWLHRVATNGSLDCIRARNRRVSREEKYARERVDRVEIEWKDIDRFVDEELAELPEKLRAPMVAHFLEGESYVSVARSLGTTRQTVTNRVDKGLVLLRKALSKRGIPVSVSALAAMMTTQLAEASVVVPVATSATLGKMAMAGALHSTSAGGASTLTSMGLGGAKLFGGIIMTKSIAVGVVAVVLVVAGALTTFQKVRITASNKTSESVASEPRGGPESVASQSGREVEGATATIAALSDELIRKDMRITELEAELAAKSAAYDEAVTESSGLEDGSELGTTDEGSDGESDPTAEVQRQMTHGHRYRALFAFLDLAPEVQSELRTLLVGDLVQRAAAGATLKTLRTGSLDTTALEDTIAQFLSEEEVQLWKDYESNPEYYQMTHRLTKELLDEIPELTNDNRFLAASIIADEFLARGDAMRSPDIQIRTVNQVAMLENASERLAGAFEDAEQNAFFDYWVAENLSSMQERLNQLTAETPPEKMRKGMPELASSAISEE